MQDSERALVPLGSGCAGPPPVPGGRIDMPRLLAAVFGLAVEAQRRSLNAAGAVAGRLGWPLRVLARPAVAVARGSVAVAAHHLNLDGWAAPGTGRTATAMTPVIRYAEARALQGHRAGFASRVVADLVDLGVAWLLGLSVLAAAGVASYLLTGPPFQLPVLPNWLDAGAGAAIAVAYLALTWAAAGRSVGKQLAGLRVVDRGGRRLALWRSFIRAVLFVLFPAGLLWVLASRRNASLQDLVVGTAVVYDWAYHPAEEPVAADDGRLPRPARSSKQA